MVLQESIILTESLIYLLFNFNKSLRIRVVQSFNNLVLKFVAIYSARNSPADKILTATARGWHYDKVYGVKIVRALKGWQNSSIWLTNLLFTLDFRHYFQIGLVFIVDILTLCYLDLVNVNSNAFSLAFVVCASLVIGQLQRI